MTRATSLISYQSTIRDRATDGIARRLVAKVADHKEIYRRLGGLKRLPK